MRKHLPNTVPLTWQSIHGHYTHFLEWTHGPLYSDKCALCQQGVQLIMQAIQWLDGGTLVERALIWNQDGRGVWQVHPKYLDRDEPNNDTVFWPSNETKIIIVDFDPTPENMVNWFVEKFQDQFQRAHVETLYLTENDRIIFEKRLDF